MVKRRLFEKLGKMLFFATVVVTITTCLACGAREYRSQTPFFDVLSTARHSFVKISTTYKVSLAAIPEAKGEVNSYCSGTIVKVIPAGSYILTADHCTAFHDKPAEIKVDDQVTKIIDYNFNEFNTIVRVHNFDADMSLIFVPGLTQQPPIELAKKAPKEGELIFNVAIPAGFYPSAGVINLQQGYYSGDFLRRGQRLSVYSLISYGGASGSMILNYQGRLIGMLHSGHVRAPIISLSPTFEVVKKFLTDNWN